MENKITPATWSLGLYCHCPGCEEYVDLLDYGDFWEWNGDLKICESGTKRSNNVNAVCPECGNEFQVECEY